MESRCPEVGAPSGASVASRAPVAALRLWPRACRFKTAGILFPHYLVSVSEVGPACGSWICRERLTAQSEYHGRIRSSRLCGRQECLPTARDLLSQDSFADFWRHGRRMNWIRSRGASSGGNSRPWRPSGSQAGSLKTLPAGTAASSILFWTDLSLTFFNIRFVLQGGLAPPDSGFLSKIYISALCTPCSFQD